MRVAVIEHFRTWLRFDGIKRAEIIDQGGVLDGQAVRIIAREYNVGPRIRSDAANGGENGHAEAVAAIVNHAVEQWPNTLAERAAVCAACATQASHDGHTHRRQASAFSKFLWFVRPPGWIPFDKYTANALGIGHRADAVARMTAYFTELADRGFTESVQAVSDCINQHGYGPLYGERVIDKFLMLIGGGPAWRASIIHQCNMFLESAPQPTTQPLIAMAEQIGDDCGPTTLQINPNNA